MKESDLRIVSWNVNGIRAVHRKGFLQWLSETQPDILCVQETKAQPQDIPAELTGIPGYKTYYATCQRKGYSGVGLITKNEPLKVEYDFGREEFDSEGRVIMADYGDFVLFNLYCPNGQRPDSPRLGYKLKFYEYYFDIFRKMKEGGRNIIITGDINTAHHEIDLARPEENRNTSGFLVEEREWLDKLESFGFIDVFRNFNKEGENYTWFSYRTAARSRNVGWRLDYFFVNSAFIDSMKSCRILKDVQGSDHVPLELTL
jgi:exodeoxyribonuclease-3